MRYAVLLVLLCFACGLMLSCIATVTAHDPIVLQLNAAAALIFTVRADPADPDRWLVCRPVGSRFALDVVESCPSRESAERECAWQQAEFDRGLRAAREDAHLRGVRA